MIDHFSLQILLSTQCRKLLFCKFQLNYYEDDQKDTYNYFWKIIWI